MDAMIAASERPVPANALPERILAGIHGVPQLAPLTSLRFFAAAMIVLLHGQGSGIGPEWPARFALGQGVSFFFVLSGFVLAYNYPVLPDWPAARSFYVARIARIWPTHIASTLLYVLLISSISYLALPADWRAAITLAHVTLTHAWIPAVPSVVAYNSVSWSISTEFFFYLAFPWLAADWARTGRMKLVGTLMLAIAMFFVAHAVALHSADPKGMRGVIAYINPLARLFEFTLGIALCHLYRQHGPRMAAMSTARATLVEGAMVAAIVACAWLSLVIPANEAVAEVLTATGVFVMQTSGVGILAYAAAIFVFAVGRGALSRLLSARPLVFLGEISFGLYMVHTLFLLYRRQAPEVFASVPDAVVYALYWGTGLALATLLHYGVELPCQGFIRKGPGRGVHSALAVGVFCAIVAAIILFQPSNRLPPNSLADRGQNLLSGPVVFEPGYRLEKVELSRGSEGRLAALELSWRAQAEVRLGKMIAVHLLDSKGGMVGQLDFAMETGFRRARADERWVNRLPLDHVDVGSARSFALAVYDSRGLAPIAGDYPGATDWNRRRLILPIE